MDRDKFFSVIRSAPFGRLSQTQVDGVNAILDGWDAAGGGRRQHLSDMLATAYHETAATMHPIAEYGKGKGRKYGKPGKHHGQIGYGRGYVQLSWDYNYEKADKECGLNGALVANYDLALDPKIAFQIMHKGMTQGWFTGKKLSDYLYPGHTDFIGARRIINGTDKAALIAGYAEHFDDAILLAATS
jgi:hypothetical protein